MKHKTSTTLFVLMTLITMPLGSRVYAVEKKDSIEVLDEDSFPDKDSDKFSRLTELDYERIATQFGEIAAIKAVSDIEAGKVIRALWT